MKKKVFVKEGFSYKGERYVKNTIGSVEESAIEKLKGEGFIEDVAIALGVECQGEPTDLSGYVKTTEFNKVKNQYSELKSQFDTLNSNYTTLSSSLTELTSRVEALEQAQASSVSANKEA